MFDPHRTRRSDRRYYTRKGQVLQASLVNSQPVIQQNLVPAYQNYLIKNGMVNANIIQPPETIPVIGMTYDNVKYPFTDFEVTTDGTKTIDYHGVGLSAGVLMYFYENGNGDHNACFEYAPADGQNYQVTVVGIRKMYWKLITTSTENDEMFKKKSKGVYSTPDAAPFAEIIEDSMSFSPAVRITF